MPNTFEEEQAWAMSLGEGPCAAPAEQCLSQLANTPENMYSSRPGATPGSGGTLYTHFQHHAAPRGSQATANAEMPLALPTLENEPHSDTDEIESPGTVDEPAMVELEGSGSLAVRRRELAALRAQNAALRAAAAALDALSAESSGLASYLALAAATAPPPQPCPWTDASLIPRVAPEDIPGLVVDMIWHRGEMPSYEWVIAVSQMPAPIRTALDHDFHSRIYNQLGQWRSRWADRAMLTHHAEIAIEFRSAVQFALFAEHSDSFPEFLPCIETAARGSPAGEAAHVQLAAVLATIDLTGEQRARLRVLLADYEAENAAAQALALMAGDSLAAAAAVVGDGDSGNGRKSREPALYGMAGAVQAGAAAAAGAAGLAVAQNRSARAYVLLFAQVMSVLSWTQFTAGSLLMQGVMPDARQFCEIACGVCHCSFCTGEGAGVAAAASGKAACPPEWDLGAAPRPAPPPATGARQARRPSFIRR